ncbi:MULTISPECIES: hypothetical protein [unclassified Janthinobacterium]|uniref:hypothetical protein n=1 Tax=unclassified Janthinobacterium TaxID=2610881 RepID=UPI001113E2CD|nr:MULTISPECIES: hypothetical protein [unclassified Janthinobacterium]
MRLALQTETRLYAGFYFVHCRWPWKNKNQAAMAKQEDKTDKAGAMIDIIKNIIEITAGESGWPERPKTDR